MACLLSLSTTPAGVVRLSHVTVCNRSQLGAVQPDMRCPAALWHSQAGAPALSPADCGSRRQLHALLRPHRLQGPRCTSGGSAKARLTRAGEGAQLCPVLARHGRSHAISRPRKANWLVSHLTRRPPAVPRVMPASHASWLSGDATAGKMGWKCGYVRSMVVWTRQWQWHACWWMPHRPRWGGTAQAARRPTPASAIDSHLQSHACSTLRCRCYASQ